MLIAYKYRMYPDEGQREMFLKHIGACRFVYNLSLERKIKAYETDKTTLSCYTLNAMLPDLKKEFEWLTEVNSQSLQQTNRNLDSAFTRFFREKKGFPKFKSRKNPLQTFGIPQHYKVDFDNNRVKLPKIGWIKTKLSRQFNGISKTATVSMTATGKFFISILVDDGRETPEKEPFGYDSTIGLDVGITDFVTMSDGTKINNPKFLIGSIQRLKVLQRRVSQKKKGSKNRDKAKYQVAKQHEKITDQRKDFLHKVSSKAVSDNQAIAIETLNVTGMMKNHCLAQAIGDVSWSEFFRQLEYKCEWYGKTLLRIGQFEPSSKICSVCGSINDDLKLSDREWTCAGCGTLHDRDVNASINIKKFALQDQNLIGVIAPGGTGEEPVGDVIDG
ncbi:MAG: IS200/IS605 family element transposase accessory protein TnpB [ANME-2 cluster archaeon]|nr:MAG: IS200/IS605 family element transposase accessory protein TnpB [ANME-2 cluster archaeon]